ncbi:prolyl oligopeptidase family serine peptidase [Paucibacter sp. R3-3]|uniref:prolyl oligopeptidase n=1 Tax=Roseateles agri TaxID=3098619 RepID=A0ABU5DRD0_9BURK|nr:prolyl oligopeptidase family serine peptidase [Paucibacter sp. R3-3]MDY0748877.1 prolyl oligopeptidase family serine peptidase [Paucibacter sp. R3-3]
MLRSSSRIAAAALLLASAALASAAEPYPPAARQPVTNVYHGTAVVDDYQWLEDAASPATREWVAAENRLTRSALDALSGRAALRARIEALLTSRSATYYGLRRAGGVWFALKSQPPKQQPLLVSFADPARMDTEKAVVDPNVLAADGSLAIDFFEPSPDGRRVAVSLSEKGSEDGSVHLFDVASGKETDVVVPRVQYPTGGGSVSWRADGKGFFYTRYPAPGERAEADAHFYQQVYFHALGQPVERDRYVIGHDFPRIAEIALSSSKAGEQLAEVKNGDGGEASYYLLGKGAGAKWQRVADLKDGVKAALFGDDGFVYLLSRDGAPRGRLLRLPVSRPVLARAQTLLPEGEATLEHIAVSGRTLFVSGLLGGPSQLQAIDLKTLKPRVLELPPVSSVNDLVRDGDGVLALIASYTEPLAWWRLDAGGHATKTPLAMTSLADFSDCEVVREFATSKDGTRVPLNILRRKGTVLDGRNPTILYGYGGYGVSMVPGFSVTRRAWLDHGGVYAIANLRGGGEFGEAWHLAGNLTKKQTVFDDFIAAAEHLIQRSYTTPAKLAAQGGSNGGLLMGAALTQRPDLFRAVHSAVGIYDMLRVELDPNGAFNVTEFGSVKDRAQFEALYAYSPFHRVKDGTDHPALLLTTGDNDGRVNPAHSRKMLARLQAADPQGRPLLLRTTAAGGHGIGTPLSETINMQTDVFAFLFWQLGVD